jgi:hypothetical protein
MPKLAILGASEKVLLDDESNPSMINLFAALRVADTTGATIPVDALGPKSWCVVAMWKAERGDAGQTFTQQCVVRAPGGKEFGKGTDNFTFKDAGSTHTIKLNVPAIPIGVAGDITVTVWLEQGGKRMSPDHHYEITIIHGKLA